MFAVFTDFAHAADRVSGIEKLEVLTDGPIGVGTRFKETRVMHGKSSSQTMTITGFDPPASYTSEVESRGEHYYTSTFTFEPVDGGTRVTISFTGRPARPLAKLMMPLGVLMAGPLRKMIAQDLDDLAKHCGSDGSHAAG